MENANRAPGPYFSLGKQMRNRHLGNLEQHMNEQGPGGFVKRLYPLSLGPIDVYEIRSEVAKTSTLVGKIIMITIIILILILILIIIPIPIPIPILVLVLVSVLVLLILILILILILTLFICSPINSRSILG